MLIYANKRENDGVDLIFFFFFFFFASKEAYPIVRQLEKITVKKAEAKVVKCAKSKSCVPRNPPGHLSVKAWRSKTIKQINDNFNTAMLVSV